MAHQESHSQEEVGALDVPLISASYPNSAFPSQRNWADPGLGQLPPGSFNMYPTGLCAFGHPLLVLEQDKQTSITCLMGYSLCYKYST